MCLGCVCMSAFACLQDLCSQATAAESWDEKTWYCASPSKTTLSSTLVPSQNTMHTCTQKHQNQSKVSALLVTKAVTDVFLAR